jgi:hypothetical protein
VANNQIASSIDPAMDVKAKRVDTIIHPARLVTVTILSFGLYIFYWLYLTWKHYRDHTKTKNFPFWHALTVCVPIYWWYRIHAHIRSYKELMTESGVNSNLNPILFVVFFQILSALGMITWRFSDKLHSAALVIDLVSLVLTVVMLVWVQSNLNRYWKNLKDMVYVNARVGIGEVIFVLIGILAWIGTFLPD